MANNNCSKSICGMRLIDPYEIFIGLAWEDFGYDEIVLRYYHVNEYNKYVSDDIKKLSLSSMDNFTETEKAMQYLVEEARSVMNSYNLFVEEGLYETIKRNCKAEAERKKLESAD